MVKWILRILLALIGIALVYYLQPDDKLPTNTKIDKLVVTKSNRTMHAYSGGQIVKTYRVALGRNPVGGKEREGDKRTPEGEYTINDKNAESRYHKNLGVSYPNATDKKEAANKGVSPGGEIKIHGLRNGIGFVGKFHRLMDWTAGCVAVTDDEIDELYEAVEIGTPIVIKP